MYTFTYSNKQKDEFEEVNRMFRTKSKKWIACLLAVVISALMLPVSVFAAEYDQGIDVTADDTLTEKAIHGTLPRIRLP